jgi:Ras family protein T1
VQIIDTSSREADQSEVDEEIQRADVMCIVYAVNDAASKASIRDNWLPRVRRLGVSVPIILVGNKVDLALTERSVNDLKREHEPIMNEYREVETCIECSAKTSMNVDEVFFFAQKAVLYPTAVLYDLAEEQFKPKCIQAFKRIFKLCDMDKDGVLDDHEVNEFQRKCFEGSLTAGELDKLKASVKKHNPIGVSEHGLTMEGFLFLQHFFIQKGRLETIWTILRKFGYNDKLDLDEAFVCPEIEVRESEGERAEISSQGYGFLTDLFRRHDLDQDGVLNANELNELFAVCPEHTHPWEQFHFPHCTATDKHGNLTLQGFLGMWSMLCLYDYRAAMRYLNYLGFEPKESRSECLVVTQLNNPDRARTVFHALVFGAKNSGKSSILRGFLNKPFVAEHAEPLSYAVNSVDNQRVLVLHEVTGAEETRVLETLEDIARCDLFVFAYDQSEAQSFQHVLELYNNHIHAQQLLSEDGTRQISLSHVPALLVQCKSDLPKVVQVAKLTPEAFARSFKLNTVAVSPARNEFNDLFNQAVNLVLRTNRSQKPRSTSSRWSAPYFLLYGLTVGLLVGGGVVLTRVLQHKHINLSHFKLPSLRRK